MAVGVARVEQDGQEVEDNRYQERQERPQRGVVVPHRDEVGWSPGNADVAQAAEDTKERSQDAQHAQSARSPEELRRGEEEDNQPQAVNQRSRRYIRVGDVQDVVFPEYKIELPPNWPK